MNTPKTTRRGALLGLLGAAAPLAAAGKPAMRFGFTTYQWGAGWDLPTLLANCARAKAFGLEVRTDMKHAHGIELSLGAEERREIRKRIAASPVKLVGVACGERFDSPDPAKLEASMARARSFVQLAHDLGAPGLRVFGNDFQKTVAQEKTVEQVGRSLATLGKFAKDYGVLIRLENHGTIGRFPTLRRIIEIAAEPNVRIKLNCDERDAPDFAANFELVKPYLGDTLHMHTLTDAGFPYQQQFDLLAKAKWNGWCLVEQTAKVPDIVEALIGMRQAWEEMIAKAMRA